MFRFQCLLLAGVLLQVCNAQNTTEIESAVQFLLPSYCVGHRSFGAHLLTLYSVLF
jgi:hypothetical protein